MVRVVAVEVEVVAQLTPYQWRTDKGALVRHPVHSVVDYFPVTAAYDDTPCSQLVMPLIGGEVVQTHTGAEVEGGNYGFSFVDSGVTGPAPFGRGVDQWAL